MGRRTTHAISAEEMIQMEERKRGKNRNRKEKLYRLLPFSGIHQNQEATEKAIQEDRKRRMVSL